MDRVARAGGRLAGDSSVISALLAFPDLSPDKSGRACLPVAGAMRPPRQTRPDCNRLAWHDEAVARRLAPLGKAPGVSPLARRLIGAGFARHVSIWTGPGKAATRL